MLIILCVLESFTFSCDRGEMLQATPVYRPLEHFALFMKRRLRYGICGPDLCCSCETCFVECVYDYEKSVYAICMYINNQIYMQSVVLTPCGSLRGALALALAVLWNPFACLGLALSTFGIPLHSRWPSCGSPWLP